MPYRMWITRSSIIWHRSNLLWLTALLAVATAYWSDTYYYALSGSTLAFTSQITRFPSALEHFSARVRLHEDGSNSSESLPVRELGENLDLEQLTELVGRTKGYFARDYALSLGWNNVRHIIETAVLHAQILNRTLVIPSYVYARSCELHSAVCDGYADQMFAGYIVEESRYETSTTWRLPITYMFNITALRLFHPVILVSDYLRLHSIPVTVEPPHGFWLRSEYHEGASISNGDQERRPSLAVIKNAWYDPVGVRRVDMILPEMANRARYDQENQKSETDKFLPELTARNASLSSILLGILPPNTTILRWEDARTFLEEFSMPRSIESLEIPEKINEADMCEIWQSIGWEVIYTYKDGFENEHFSKQVTIPSRYVVLRESMRGFKEEFGHLQEDVVLLEGDIHQNRKPGSLLFSTAEKRDQFTNLVLYGMRPLNRVQILADRISKRMMDANEVGIWMSGHIRRGDFIKEGWVMEKTIENHLLRVQKHFTEGLKTLRSLCETGEKLSITDADVCLLDRPPERYYIATDERDPGNLTYLRDNGAVLIGDLLTVEDRQEFGWSLIFTDILGLVEQAVLARASFFYGHGLSSVAGGVANLRHVLGYDSRTTHLDSEFSYY